MVIKEVSERSPSSGWKGFQLSPTKLPTARGRRNAAQGLPQSLALAYRRLMTNLSDLVVFDPAGASVRLGDVVDRPTVIDLVRYYG